MSGQYRRDGRQSASGIAPIPMNDTTFALRGDHIALDALLKASGLAGSGGAAKIMITGGDVKVDGAVETRRSAKIRAGQVVEAAGARITLVSA